MKANSQEFSSKVVQAQPSLHSLAMKLTSNPNDASDLVQETTLKALHAEGSFIEKTNFSGWIMTIMRNTFLNNCRNSKRISVVLDQAVDDEQLLKIPVTSTSPAPDSVYSANQISQIIAQLPDSQRVPFSMLIEGYSYSEIAQKLNFTPGIVKSRILNARRALRAKLSDA